jgi:hypothetical protein
MDSQERLYSSFETGSLAIQVIISIYKNIIIHIAYTFIVRTNQIYVKARMTQAE